MVVCSGVSHIGISDQSLVYAFRKLSIGLSTKGHSIVSYRKFKHFNTANFRSDICSQDWDSINSFNDPNSMWRAWKNTFSNVVDRHAPIRIKRVRTSKSMNDRDVLKIKAIRSNDLSDWRVFKNCRNAVNNDVKLAKEMYDKNAFHENEGNSRKTWGIINELTSKNPIYI